MSESQPGNSRPLIGCFPLYPPLELFHSMGMDPRVLWGLEETIDGTDLSDLHVQAFSCAVARRLMQFALGPLSSDMAAVFSYNACDTLRNLPEPLQKGMDSRGRSLEYFRMHLPAKDLCAAYASNYLKNEITGLISSLEKFMGRAFSITDFRASVEVYRRYRSLISEAQELVADGRMAFDQLGGMSLYEASTSIEGLTATLGQRIVAARKNPADHSGIPILISGISAARPFLTPLFQEAGLVVAANDVAGLRRANAYTPAEFDSAEEYYLDFYKNHFPCPTLAGLADKRAEAILGLARQSKARGFVFIGEKFCEYEYLEYPYIEKRLTDAGLKCLFIELSIDDEGAGPIHTRVEAFAELLKKQT